MHRKRIRMLVSALAVVLALAVAVPALAANSGTSTRAGGCGSEAWGGEGQGGMRGVGVGGQMSVAIADLLEMESADLAAERQAGKSLAEIAESKGITTDALISAMLEAHKAALDEAIADGRITQERADLMLQNMSDRIADRIDDTQVGPPAGRGGGAHGRSGQGTCDTCTDCEQ